LGFEQAWRIVLLFLLPNDDHYWRRSDVFWQKDQDFALTSINTRTT